MKKSRLWEEVASSITVIIPVFNSIKTIEKTIKSLDFLRENGVNILISDNSSTDGTKKILEKYEKYKNIKVFYQERNIGAKSIQLLIENVKTEFLLPIGSDDYLVKYTSLPLTLKKIKENKNAVGCSFRSRFIYENFLVDDKTNVSLCGSDSKKFRKFFMYIGANSRYYGIIKTDLFKKYYPNNFYFGFDVSLSAKILSHGDWLYDKNIHLHRERGGSANPFVINKAHGFLFIPPFRYFRECIDACPEPRLSVKVAWLYYYFKIIIGPIRHIVLGK
tara:strand:- start:17701 stop:18528 length:828 start_codon:yes stop_codon:yes gene_type:complete